MNPLTIRRTHSQTCHVSGAAVIKVKELKGKGKNIIKRVFREGGMRGELSDINIGTMT